MIHTVTLFGTSAGSYLNLISAFTGIGKLVAPMIAGSFLTEQSILEEYQKIIHPDEEAENRTWISTKNFAKCDCVSGICFGTHCKHKYTIHYLKNYEFGKRLYIPFMILMFVLVATGVMCLYVYFCLKPKSDIRQENEPNKKTSGFKRFKEKLCTCIGIHQICVFLGLLILYTTLTVCTVGGEYYLYPILMVSDLDFTRSQATWLNTVFHASLSISRFVAMGILLYISIKIFMNVMLTMAVLICGLWAFIGLNSKQNMWSLSPLFTFFFAPTYASGLAYADQYVEVTGVITALLDFGTGVAMIAATWLLAWLLENNGPQFVLIDFFACTILCLIISCFIYVSGLIFGDRFEKRAPKIEEERHPLFQEQTND